MTTRRDLLSGAGALLQPVPAKPVGRPAPVSSRRIRLGVVGGGFGTQFFFHQHPNCDVAAVTDLRADRRAALRGAYRCDAVYDSLDAMLAGAKLDAVAVFSGATEHVTHVEACMRRGLHVLSAVPACMTMEEADRLRDAKERTGLRYMMAETSWYRPGCIYARHAFQAGLFGEIFYSELAYYHDRGDLRRLTEDKTSRFYEPGGERSWRWGLAPLHYPTHCLGFVVGVTDERILSVSALGWGTQHPYLSENRYSNPHWNESALMETSGGHMTRCNVFWLVAEDGERAQWFGDRANLYMANGGLHGDTWRPRGDQGRPLSYPDYLRDPMLPAAMRHASGHGGSHVFLAAEFINALIEDREPEVNVYRALAMTVPGIAGHRSALKKGERLRVPVFEPAVR